MKLFKLINWICIYVFIFLFIGCEEMFRNPLDYSGTSSNNSYQQAPKITRLVISGITNETATVIWYTDKPSNSNVIYNEDLGTEKNVLDSTYVIEHFIQLKNLKSSTKYNITATSEDPLGNLASSSKKKFVTELNLSNNSDPSLDTSGDTLGPITSSLTSSPNPTVGATSVSLGASVSDSGTGGSTISAAEYFVDTTGTNGTGTAMSAQDGTLNSIIEAIQATINISGWSVGTYRIYVHAKDSQNNWGSFQYVDLSVTSGDISGPITSSLTSSPNPTVGATSVSLGASVSDSGTGGSTISAAEYFVDTTGTNGTGTAMSAQDGTLNSITEAVQATINISGWSVGTYRIYVHAKDSQNNWGSFQYVDLSVTSGDISGPITSSLTSSPNPTVGATSVSLGASVSDSGTGGSTISAAEYFVDTTGTNGTGTAMSAQDGTLNSITEAVQATINISGWS